MNAFTGSSDARAALLVPADRGVDSGLASRADDAIFIQGLCNRARSAPAAKYRFSAHVQLHDNPVAVAERAAGLAVRCATASRLAGPTIFCQKLFQRRDFKHLISQQDPDV